jgi:hypothetical protein
MVVTIAKLRTHSPAGECQFSHKPARAMMPRSARASAYGCFPVAVLRSHKSCRPAPGSPALERFAECRLALNPLRLGVDVGEPDLDVLGPVRDQAPAQHVETALRGLGVYGGTAASTA